MTALEKLRSDYPEFADKGVDYIVENLCTDTRGCLEAPEYCPLGGMFSWSEWEIRCRKCWNREIPEEEKEKDMIQDTTAQCHNCNHNTVCKFKDDLAEAGKAFDKIIGEVTIEDGSNLKVIDLDFIYPVELKCKYRSSVTETIYR